MLRYYSCVPSISPIILPAHLHVPVMFLDKIGYRKGLSWSEIWVLTLEALSGTVVE